LSLALPGHAVLEARDGPADPVVLREPASKYVRSIPERFGSPQPWGKPPKLLDQARSCIRARHLSRRTEQAYVAWVRGFGLFNVKRHPASMGESQVRDFLSYLAVRRKVSSSKQNQALSALLFLYRDVLGVDLEPVTDVVRAKKPKRIPVVLCRSVVRAVRADMRGVLKLVASLLYSCGLRLLECLDVRIKDVGFERKQIVVRGWKGAKDRVTMLPRSLESALREQIERAREIAVVKDGLARVRVVMAGALEKELPSAGLELAWQYVFPARSTYADRAPGEERRHHFTNMPSRGR